VTEPEPLLKVDNKKIYFEEQVSPFKNVAKSGNVEVLETTEVSDPFPCEYLETTAVSDSQHGEVLKVLEATAASNKH
jgi:hypothetical protein